MSHDYMKDAMVSHETAQLRGQLAAAKREFDDADVLVQGAIIQIRQLINPYEPDPTKLNVDDALSAMERLRTHVHRMRDLLTQITRIKSALGEK